MSFNVNSTDREIASNERQSLLDMLENKNQAANIRTSLHRVIMVGKLRNTFSNKSELGEYYDKMFRNLQNANSKTGSNPFIEKVTGFLLIYPALMIHTIESSLETIKLVLRNMEEMTHSPDGMISDAKIICFAHDIHVSLYPVYSYKMMNFTIEFDSSEPAESVETLVNETVIRLLRLGKYLNDQSKISLKKEVFENIHEQHPEFLPNQNHANYFLKCDILWSPREYLQYYEKPLEITLESELIWPAPNKLFPYQ